MLFFRILLGEIEVVNDFRHSGDTRDKVIGFTFYYPYNFQSPFAAYLIPSDLEVGDRVWIEGVIEDIVASRWSQGETFRLNYCEAIWDGKDITLEFVAPLEDTMIG